jgi:hypothetical protein
VVGKNSFDGWHALTAQPGEHALGKIMPTPPRGEGMPPHQFTPDRALGQQCKKERRRQDSFLPPAILVTMSTD